MERFGLVLWCDRQIHINRHAQIYSLGSNTRSTNNKQDNKHTWTSASSIAPSDSYHAAPITTFKLFLFAPDAMEVSWALAHEDHALQILVPVAGAAVQAEIAGVHSIAGLYVSISVLSRRLIAGRSFCRLHGRCHDGEVRCGRNNGYSVCRCFTTLRLQSEWAGTRVFKELRLRFEIGNRLARLPVTSTTVDSSAASEIQNINNVQDIVKVLFVDVFVFAHAVLFLRFYRCYLILILVTN